MKKIIISISAALVVMSVVFAGCGMDKDKNNDKTTTGTTTTTTTTTESTTEKENLEDKITSVLEDATSIFDRESSAATTNR